MSKDLESNVFQWRNLYIHRFGVCTYAPPMPKDPETTTSQYPTTAGLMALRASLGVAVSDPQALAAAGIVSTPLLGGSSTQGTGASASPTTPFLAPPAAAAVEGVVAKSVIPHVKSNVPSTSYQQRRADLERQKKLQRQEAIRQNPHGLATSVLRLHQAAWRLIMDDAILGQSMKLSQEYSQLTHVLQTHVQRTTRESAAGAMSGGYRRGPQLLVASRRSSILSSPVLKTPTSPGGSIGRRFTRVLMGSSANVDNDDDLDDGPFSASFRALDGSFSEAHRSLLACGPDHVFQLPLKDDNSTSSALYEFSPFFVAVSPPEDVTAMEEKIRSHKFLTLPDMRAGGGQSELLGLPMFSQFTSWQEAYQRRAEWPFTPFHFFLAHDSSYNFAQCAALLTLLEMYSKHKHLHIPDAAQVAAKLMPKKKSRRDKVTEVALGVESSGSPSPKIEIVVADRKTSVFNVEASGSLRLSPSAAVETPDDRQGVILRLLLALDRTTTAAPKVLCSRIACCVSTVTGATQNFLGLAGKPAPSTPSGKSDGRNSCPLLAFEAATEDLILVFENSANRNAFRLLFSLFHFFLQKALKPGQAARHLLTSKHIFPFDDQEKLTRIVSTMQSKNRKMSKRKARKLTVGGDMIDSDDDNEDDDDDNAADAIKEEEEEEASLLQEEDEDKAAKLSVFSELEFNALFHLAGYFVDLGFNTPLLKLRPGGLPQSGGKDEAVQLHRLAHQANLQATSTFAEAVVRFESGEQSRVEKKRLVSQLAANAATCPLNIQRKIKFHEDQVANEEKKAEPYTAAANLAFPLILIGSYMRLHGSTWIRQVTANVVNFLSMPDVQIYVTQEMLDDPRAAFTERGKVRGRQSSTAAASPSTSASDFGQQSGSTTKESTKVFQFASVVQDASIHHRKSITKGASSATIHTSPIITHNGDSKNNNNNNSAQQDPSSEFLFSEESPQPQPLNIEDLATPQEDPLFVASPPPAADKFRGYSDAEREMFLLLESAEEVMCIQIEKALKILFQDLERSHFFQRIPAGISRLITELCTTVHAQLLSGIVVLPPDRSSVGPPPSGNELVELYISTLIGEKRKKLSTAAPKKQRGGVTMLVDEPSPKRADGVAAASCMDAKVVLEGSPTKLRGPESNLERDKKPPPEVETNITLITDIRRYRLAKFVLFDGWILPTLNNALRYNLVDSSSSLHLLRNLDALARYVKIVLNGPFCAREMDRRSSQPDFQRDESVLLSGSFGPTSRTAAASKTMSSEQTMKKRVTVVMQPFISGMYNASTGGLVQLFAPPPEISTDALSEDDSASNADSSEGSVHSGGGGGVARRRSSAVSGGRRKSRRSSSVSSDDGKKLTRSSTKGPATASGARRRSSVKLQAKPNSSKQLAMPLRRVTFSFPAQTDSWWPTVGELSPSLLRLNNVCGTVASSSSSVPNATPQQTPLPSEDPSAIPTLANYFCWRASTSEEPNIMMPEYAAPPSAIAQAVESLHAIATGRHPAVFPRPPVSSALLDDGSEEDSASSSDSTAHVSQREDLPFNEEEGRAQYVRTLHSVLHFPTFASRLLDNINTNNKKLFQYLVKPSSFLAGPLNRAAAKYSQGGSQQLLQPTARPVAENLTDYTHLWSALATLIVQRDVPLVNVNEILSVIAMSSEQPTKGNGVVLPPPSLVAAYLRLAQRQQFVTTALALPLTTAPSSGGSSSSGFLAALAESGDTSNARTGSKRDLSPSSPKRPLHDGGGHPPDSVDPQRHPSHGVEGSDCPFHSFYSGLTIALCTKAAAVLEESSQKSSDDWVRKCARHLTRSYNEQMALQQLTNPEITLASPTSPAKRKKLTGETMPPTTTTGANVVLALPPKKPMAAGTDHDRRQRRRRPVGDSRRVSESDEKSGVVGGGITAARRPVIADRWKRAVTDMVMVDLLKRQSSNVNTNE
jgi:hypothetical protein